MQNCGFVFTQREGFEPSCCCQQTDFEQMGMRPVSSHIVPENGGFLGIFAGLYAVYEKFAGKLRDDCEMDGGWRQEIVLDFCLKMSHNSSDKLSKIKR